MSLPPRNDPAMSESTKHEPAAPAAMLLMATTNAGKAREFAAMLGNAGFEWCDLSTLKQSVGEVDETGQTFLANACLKASEYAQRTGFWTLADDSGLEVDALNGKPGVVSARWAALHDAGSGDPANNALLLRQLADVPDDARTARFVCTLALSDPSGIIRATARDTVEGHIIREPRGVNGFGYDPLFFLRDRQQTMAELSSAQKHEISHRGRAVRRMTPLLRMILNEQKVLR